MTARCARIVTVRSHFCEAVKGTNRLTLMNATTAATLTMQVKIALWEWMRIQIA